LAETNNFESGWFELGWSQLLSGLTIVAILISEYFPEVFQAGDVCVQILASGPADERWRAIHTFLFAVITLAHKRIRIETPDFVPDAPMMMAKNQSEVP